MLPPLASALKKEPSTATSSPLNKSSSLHNKTKSRSPRRLFLAEIRNALARWPKPLHKPGHFEVPLGLSRKLAAAAYPVLISIKVKLKHRPGIIRRLSGYGTALCALKPNGCQVKSIEISVKSSNPVVLSQIILYPLGQKQSLCVRSSVGLYRRWFILCSTSV